MAWRRLGVNLIEEWLEEDASGRRRVQTPAGPIPEPCAPDLRFGRLSSSADALLWADGMSRSTVFSSYGSLSLAHAVWSTPIGSLTPSVPPAAPPQARQLAEAAMARRVWRSATRGASSPDLPLWDAAMRRPGPHGWPLGLDVGVWRRILSPQEQAASMELDRYVDGPSFRRVCPASSPARSSDTIVLDGNTSWRVQTSISLGQMSLADWAGSAPPALEDDVWQSSYIPMSDPQQDESGYVDPLLNQALRRARPQASPDTIRHDIADALGIDASELSDRLSADQVDAVWLAHRQLIKKRPFLLADETGYGKGRVLAALARLGLRLGYQVLLVTEKAPLFSDFHRDCRAVWSGAVPDPVLLHPMAKVVDELGQPAVPNKQRRSAASGDTWVWTTYSQFNRGLSERLTGLLAWMSDKPTWVLMDEAQNAAGESKTALAIEAIQKSATGLVLSSATFAKNEDQLAAYKRLFQGTAAEWARLTAGFHADSDSLRTAITLLWAEQGVFLRREHPPMPLPMPMWVAPTAEMHIQAEQFASWWRAMHDCASVWARATNSTESIWSRIGEPLARATREFSLLQKLPAVAAAVVACHQDNKKAVVVSDWTLSSHMTRQIDSGSSDLEPSKDTSFLQPPTSWPQSWSLLIDTLFPDDELNAITSPLATAMKVSRDRAKTIAEQMPHWSVSPFDDLIAAVRAHGVRLGEISGRTHELHQDGTIITIRPRIVEARTTVVRQFNQGDLDALLITRAGNSGISLHAGKTCADQRQRHLIEWDVSPDASVRIQFWGRVRRKDQVSEPLRSTLLVDTPAERRRLHKDVVKHNKLMSHSGSLSTQNEVSWLSPAGVLVAKDWIKDNPTPAALLGGAYVSVEQMLSRSIILPDSDRLSLLSSLQRGVDLIGSWDQGRLDVWDHPSRCVRRQWWWGQGDHALQWTERVWPARPAVSAEQVFAELQKHAQGASFSGADVMARWAALWTRWFSAAPSAATLRRRQILAWWQQNAVHWERARGLEAKDPHTGARTRGLVLGWDPPPTDDPALWSPSSIGVWVWLASCDRPVRLSLAAWMSRRFGAANALPQSPQPSWFGATPLCTSALVLEGPPWSVAAWGARHNPFGQLIHTHDDTGRWGWGWKMPMRWGWSDMLATDRELANVPHALSFWRDHPHEHITWRWAPDDILLSTPQDGGLVVVGYTTDSQEHLPFKISKQIGAPRWAANGKEWAWHVPWRHVAAVSHSWFSSGAIPTISAQHAKWHAAKWRASS